MAKRLLPLLMALLLNASAVMLPPAARAAVGASPWQWRHPYPQANHLTGITYGSGQFVAVGERGSILTSPDGDAWTWQDSGTKESLKSPAYGGGRYVVLGQRDNLFTSPDGATWTLVDLPAEIGSLMDVAYGNGLFVAVATSGWATSADGVSWSYRRRAETLPEPRRIAFGAGRFVAAGESSVLISTDGAAWSERLTGYRNFAYDMSYTGERFLILGSQGLLTSSDGLAWQQSPVPREVMARGLAAGGGRLAAVGSGGRILSSPDGAVAVWQDVSPDPATVPDITSTLKTSLEDVAHGGGTFAAVGGDGIIFTSADGIAWTPRHRGSRHLLTSVGYGAGRYVAVGGGGTILVSANGHQWDDVPVPMSGPAPFLAGVRFLNGRFLALGARGLMLASTDGLAWEPVAAATDQRLMDAAFSGTAYVAVGSGGTVLRSEDGLAWTATILGERIAFTAVTYAAGTFVAVGRRMVMTTPTSGYDQRLIATSPDGHTWTVRIDERGYALSGVAYGNGAFVAVDQQGTVLHSGDGAVWTVHTAAGGPGRIAFDGAMFIGVAGTRFLASGDGLRWIAGMADGWNLSGVTAHGGQYVITGDKGAVLVGEGTGTGCGTAFPDVPAVLPACGAIEGLAARKVAGGFPDGSFRPFRTLTRAEAARLLAAARGWAPVPGGEPAFTDVAGHWAQTQGYVQAAVAHGALQGFPDRTFRPDAPVTRAQLIKMAAAAAGLAAVKEPGSVYWDLPSGHWALGWAAAARQAGLIGSSAAYPLWSGTNLGPDQEVTRAEAAMLLANMQAAHP